MAQFLRNALPKHFKNFTICESHNLCFKNQRLYKLWYELLTYQNKFWRDAFFYRSDRILDNIWPSGYSFRLKIKFKISKVGIFVFEKNKNDKKISILKISKQFFVFEKSSFFEFFNVNCFVIFCFFRKKSFF